MSVFLRGARLDDGDSFNTSTRLAPQHEVSVQFGFLLKHPDTKKSRPDGQLLCRGGQIRTDDLLLPKQARYRATLRPERAANVC